MFIKGTEMRTYLEMILVCFPFPCTVKKLSPEKEQSDLDIGLPDGIQDKDYLQILYNKLPELIQLVEPDIIFYQSGVDIIEFDKLGRLGVSIDGCKSRDRFVFEQAHINHIPIVTSMGGGIPLK